MFVQVGAVQSGGLEQLLDYSLIGTWESVGYVDEGRILVLTPPSAQSPYVVHEQNKPIFFSELVSLPVVLTNICAGLVPLEANNVPAGWISISTGKGTPLRLKWCRYHTSSSSWNASICSAEVRLFGSSFEHAHRINVLVSTVCHIIHDIHASLGRCLLVYLVSSTNPWDLFPHPSEIPYRKWHSIDNSYRDECTDAFRHASSFP
jgi:hypothetical protein